MQDDRRIWCEGAWKYLSRIGQSPLIQDEATCKYFLGAGFFLSQSEMEKLIDAVASGRLDAAQAVLSLCKDHDEKRNLLKSLSGKCRTPECSVRV